MATITPMTNCQNPLKISPATMREAIPIRIVTIQPIGSAPGWKSRPRAPTIAPTMMSHTHSMTSTFPARGPAETRQERARRERSGPPVKDQSLIEEMREAMKEARERAEERREHSHESPSDTEPEARPEPEPELEPEPEPEPVRRRRRFFRR